MVDAGPGGQYFDSALIRVLARRLLQALSICHGGHGADGPDAGEPPRPKEARKQKYFKFLSQHPRGRFSSMQVLPVDLLHWKDLHRRREGLVSVNIFEHAVR